MGHTQKISRVMIGAILFILMIYAVMHMNWKVNVDPFYKIMAQVSEVFMAQAESSYLTSFTYVKGDCYTTAGEWLAGTVMEQVPLGTYVEEKSMTDTDVEDKSTYEMILAQQANDENAVDENGNLIPKDGQEEQAVQTTAPQIDTSLEKMMNFEYLVSNFYTVDSSTMLNDGELNAQDLLGRSMKIDQQSQGPKVLIYHTHSQEAFADSVEGDAGTTIVGMGTYLTELLGKYGIETIHHEGIYDLIDGELDRSKAYDLAEPEVQKILNDNPSIEVVIDLHRDGVGDDTHLVTEVNGKPTAQIMFFNGLSRTRANGEIDYLANPYIQDNLAFSLQMKIAADNQYPGFTRHIYLRGYRYNMHLKPKTLLVEAGAQTNTVEEMRNAMEILAETLDHVLTD